MRRRNRQASAATSCSTVCSAGQLALERAEQGHVLGTLRIDVVRDGAGQDARGCPVVDRRELMVSFNITSANAGQDTEMFRSLSDEMLRQMGYSQEDIDAVRRQYSVGARRQLATAALRLALAGTFPRRVAGFDLELRRGR